MSATRKFDSFTVPFKCLTTSSRLQKDFAKGAQMGDARTS